MIGQRARTELVKQNCGEKEGSKLRETAKRERSEKSSLEVRALKGMSALYRSRG